MSDSVASVGPPKRQEPAGAVALGLALIVMILPLEGDILWTLHRENRTALERLIWLGCFLVVAIPFAISWRCLRRYPRRWRRGKENLLLTGSILALNVIALVIALWSNVI
jgi:hypothetical protein